MRFTTKDLLVTILPRPKDCLFGTHICKSPSLPDCADPSRVVGCGGGCSVLLSKICSGNSCGPGASACDPTALCGKSWDPFVIEHLEDLVTLRAELHATLKSLDEIQKEGLPSSSEVLERGLTEALEQVRSAKKNLSRKS